MNFAPILYVLYAEKKLQNGTMVPSKSMRHFCTKREQPTVFKNTAVMENQVPVLY